MQPVTRIIINTSAQYLKTFFNILFSLFSIRIILRVLGECDFGIYSLIAGVVSMLAFITNALSSTTQRYLSYHQGKYNLKELQSIFSNSLFLHLIIGTFISIILFLCEPLLFDGFLNISIDRLVAARKVYYFVVFLLLFTFLSAPYRAVLISHENIVYISLIDVIDGVLKLVIAIILIYVPYDKLVMYACLLFCIQVFNFFAISIFATIKYKECKLLFSLIRLDYIREISSFAGWSIYSVGCIVGRTQGIAIVLNRFFGTVVNAAYGLGFQISGYINFMSESLLNAVKPQIMKAEGLHQRKEMLKLSESACKYSFYLLSILAVPCIFEMPRILLLWLGDIPQYSILFCRMVMFASLVDSLTIALGSANQAIGNVKEYSIFVNTIKLLTLPIVFLFVKFGASINYVAIIYVLFELICALIRIIFLHKNGGLDIHHFLKNVFAKEIIPFSVFVLISFVLVYFIDADYRIVLTFIIPNIIYVTMIYFWGMDYSEQTFCKSLIASIFSHLKH